MTEPVWTFHYTDLDVEEVAALLRGEPVEIASGLPGHRLVVDEIDRAVGRVRYHYEPVDAASGERETP